MSPIAPLSDSSSTLPLPNTQQAPVSAAFAYQKIKTKIKTERGDSKWVDELKRDALAAVGELVGTCAFLCQSRSHCHRHRHRHTPRAFQTGSMPKENV